MGLVTRRSMQLDKLFDQFAVDPKKTKKQPKDAEKEKKQPRRKIITSNSKATRVVLIETILAAFVLVNPAF